MAKDQAEPLLTNSRPSSDQSSERFNQEEEALYSRGQQHDYPSKKYGWAFWREIGLVLWAVIATALVIVLAVLYQQQRISQPSDGTAGDGKLDGKRNLVFMVSDGMGPSSLALTRSFAQKSNNLPFDHRLTLDEHLIGSSRTRSNSSLITDSAAGATAWSCGFKSYNGAISIMPDKQPCGTVMEAAKKAGYMTGLVVTTGITDATPACFASHANLRDQEDRIAEQEVGHGHPLGRVVDLILGGGRCRFLPNTTENSCRSDATDVIKIAKDLGWNYASNRSDFDKLGDGSNIKLPMLGLFADYDIPYEIDRKEKSDEFPSLTEMSTVALNALSAATKDSDKGFFLVIEGSRIDHAGHSNDPVAQVHEILEYDNAFSTVLDFLEKDPVQSIVVGTSDHETGGLATARQLHDENSEDHWFPEVLMNATHSAGHLAIKLIRHMKTHTVMGSDPTKTWLRTQLVGGGLGIHDATDEEVEKIYNSTHTAYPPTSYTFADLISRRAQVGWTTHGHSGVDVNVYASDPKVASKLVGNHENTEVGDFLREYLDVDVKGITDELKKKAKEPAFVKALGKGERGWLGHEIVVGDTKAPLDHYEGDFRKRAV